MFNVTLPPAADMSEVTNLLALITDPVACKARMDEIVAASSQAINAIEQSEKARDELAKQTQAMTQQRQDFERAAATRQADLDRQRDQNEAREAKLTQRDAALQQREAALAVGLPDLDAKIAAAAIATRAANDAVTDSERKLADRESALAQRSQALDARESAVEALRSEYQTKLDKLKQIAG